MSAYEVVIGLEVHAQLQTKTKLFCRCANTFGKAENTLTCPVCLGFPGALPVLNEQAVKFAVQAGLALGCTIDPTSIFDRKNYFYPDLPKGYQITQMDRPLCKNGKLSFETKEGLITVGIDRIHMEEDAGKLVHGDNLQNTEGGSLVDLNRAGVPLIEIVSRPDLRSAAHAALYLKKLRSILKTLGVCDGNMEEGSLRCDANVSLRPVGSETFGTKVEIKNMNSFKFIEKAILFEIERQTLCLQRGEKIAQETRQFDATKGQTFSMRSKEESFDYRYFPDPDLPPLKISQAWIQDVKSSMNELPDERKARFENDWKLPSYDAGVLTAEKDIADFFEKIIELQKTNEPEKIKKCSNFMMSEVLRVANDKGVEVANLLFGPQDVSDLLNLVDSGSVSGKMAKEILEDMNSTGKKPAAIVQEKGLAQNSNADDLLNIIQSVIAKNPSQHADYKSGKDKLFGFFVGQVMKETKGSGNPAMINELLKKELLK